MTFTITTPTAGCATANDNSNNNNNNEYWVVSDIGSVHESWSKKPIQ